VIRRLLLLLSMILAGILGRAAPPEPVIFTGMCDASAAAAISPELFIVADDEANILRVYRRGGGPPILEFDLRTFLGTQEVDIEGAAPIGQFVFWIGSHGRNARGKDSPARQRLFATRVDTRGNSLEVTPMGQPYARLLDDLLADERYTHLGLASAAERAPKDAGGLNIEGLAATPDGRLLIGFRNPLPEGKAIVAPLLNPIKVLEGDRAQLGEPRLLDLGGLGIRSMGWVDDHYLIIAGPTGEGGGAKLYEWPGGAEAPQLVRGVQLRGLNPEGVVFRDKEKTEYLLLSDDGTRTVDGEECKTLKDPARKRFRGVVLKF
jgi:hypothetical protein